MVTRKAPAGARGAVTSTIVHGVAGRFEIAETQVVVPPELQCLQTADAARSQFAAGYLPSRLPLRFCPHDSTSRCDVYSLSRWMVMAVVDVASVNRFES